MTPGPNFTERITYTGVYNITDLGFDMSFNVQCSENYYGPNCTTFCDPIEGVYTCDREGRVVCINERRDPDSNCTMCLQEWDLNTNCATCLSSYDILSNCTECLTGFDIRTSCTTCLLPGYDIQSSCSRCITGRDISTNCTTCLPGYDPSTGCTECLPNVQCKPTQTSKF